MSAIPDILEQLETAVDEDKAEFTLTNMQTDSSNRTGLSGGLRNILPSFTLIKISIS